MAETPTSDNVNRAMFDNDIIKVGRKNTVNLKVENIDYGVIT